MVETIKKRNGVVVAFDAQKIYNAIFKANIRIADEKLTEQQLNALTKEIVSTFQTTQDVPTVEQIQDAVEEHLITHGYAKTAKELEEITGRTYSRIHVVGGGSNAGYLNELTAKATGKEVHAGPGEATAIGNITAQMLKAGDFKSVEEARTTIHESFGIKIYK